MTNCASSCPTQDHASYGACLRSKNLQLNPNLSDTKTSKDWDRDLQKYRDARKQGIRPDGTSASQVQRAEQMSQQMGQAYDASKPMFDVAIG